MAWAIGHTDGFAAIMGSPSQFEAGGKKEGLFWATFWPSLTAMVGFWATLALNIPDFTRFARSQKDQVVGQSIGLPLPMGLLALMSVIVTAATVVIYGQAIWDPVDLAGRFTGIIVGLALLFLTLDTMCCNLAANLVGPAYDFASLAPKKISYKIGGLITAGIALIAMPWKILASTQGYIFTWLIGYSALLAPIGGVMIADYFVYRRRQLNVPGLPKANPSALTASVDKKAPPTVVGSSTTYQCQTTGGLYLGPNDSGLDNNSGTWDVTLTPSG